MLIVTFVRGRESGRVCQVTVTLLYTQLHVAGNQWKQLHLYIMYKMELDSSKTGVDWSKLINWREELDD